MQVRHLFGGEARFLKVQVPGLFFTEHTVDHQHMKMQVSIVQSAEIVGEDAAFKVAAEFTFSQCRGLTAKVVVVQRQPGGEVDLDDAVENRAFGLAPVVNGRRTARFGGSDRHVSRCP